MKNPKNEIQKKYGIIATVIVIMVLLLVLHNNIQTKMEHIESQQTSLIAKEKELLTLQENIAVQQVSLENEQIEFEEKKKNTMVELQKTEEELKERTQLLAKIIGLEKRGNNPKDLDAKTAVGLVVLNRVESERFPDTIKEVIFQRNQFQPTFDGAWEKHEPTPVDFEAAELAIQNYKVVGEHGKSINSALFFLDPDTAAKKNLNWFRNNLKYLDTLGGHEFYTYKN